MHPYHLPAGLVAGFTILAITAVRPSVWWPLPECLVVHARGRKDPNRGFSLLSSASVSISDAFDGGNVDFVKAVDEYGRIKVVLRLKRDPKIHHSQSFCFRSTVTPTDSQPRRVDYVIENAKRASYASAYEGMTIFTATTHSEPDSWIRLLETSYDGEQQLAWSYQHATSGSVYFAYFPPYSYERHLAMISRYAATDLAHVESLGQSLDGRDIEYVTAGSGPRHCWIIHRQHPGESMAEFYAEGLLTRLLGLEIFQTHNDTVRRALELYTFHIIPNMNPDGTQMGYMRTNAGGADLNREWESSKRYRAPTLERSPEVYYVLTKMEQTGVDIFLDVHGEENLPYCFLIGSEGCTNWGIRLQNIHGAFLAAYSRANSDMNQKYGYERPERPESCFTSAASWLVATRFDCLAVTLEMPFKDCRSNPDPVKGWSPARSKKLGASVLEALVYVQPYLRDNNNFWELLPEDDTYIRPTRPDL